MDQPEPQDTSARPEASGAGETSLSTIFWVFFQIGSLSVGGGLTAWLYREIVENRKLMSGADFMSALTLAQVLPGINMANLSVYVGQRLRGIKGALAAMLGLTLVPFFAIIALGSVYAQLQAVPAIHNVLDGMAAAAVGLLLAMSVKAVRVTRMGTTQIVIAAIVVVAIGLMRWPMVPVILVLAPISVALAWQGAQNESGKGGGDA